jgi:Glycosyl transferase 4-like domain
VPLKLHAMGIRNPRYLAWRGKIPWLRYGYTPHFVPWLKENAKRYDAIVVHGLWNYVALGSWRALASGGTPYFVYAHGMLDPYFNKVHRLKAFAKQVLWWFSEGLLANASNVFFATEEERRLARQSFWPYRCRNASWPSARKTSPAAPMRRLLRSALCFRNWPAANSSYF